MKQMVPNKTLENTINFFMLYELKLFCWVGVNKCGETYVEGSNAFYLETLLHDKKGKFICVPWCPKYGNLEH